ncbi:MAG: STAS domain-containing protein [Phycisphaerales bacterium]
MSRHRLPTDPSQPAFIEKIEQEDGVRIVRLFGKINQTNVQEGYEYIVALHRQGEDLKHHLLLDCACVENIDFSAVALLVMRMHDYFKAQRRIALVHCDERVRTYLGLADLEPSVQVFANEKEALAAFAEHDSCAK